MVLPAKTTVLIVGAGPAGLAAALSLHNNFHNNFMLDAVPHTSRAKVIIHMATLEALDASGYRGGPLSKGNKCTTFDGRTLHGVSTPYFEGLK